MKKKIALFALAICLMMSFSGEVNAQTLMSMFPVIDYASTGTGKGPGANFIKGVDYENIGMSSRHSLGDINWWELTTWTADNGVVLKVVPADSGYPYGVVPVVDGCGLDLIPGSPFMIAVSECRGDAEIWGKKKNDLKFLKKVQTQVPKSQIRAASKKKKSIDVNNAALIAYKEDYESIMNSTGVIEGDLLIYDDVVMHRDIGGANYWLIKYDKKKKAWMLQINVAFGYMYEWDGIRNMLKYISPDGEALYDTVYDDFYLASRDNPIEEYDKWFRCGKKAKIKRATEDAYGFKFRGAVYYIK
ncbi:MAG: hypothetical protein K5853_06270 [Lachnospiraceae bacterium]|nr:hypothetical protein [Lachnospiraceae bacterium]